MKNKILYLPLDERPCNYVYPQYIANIGGVSLAVPPLNLMGNFKKPADIDGLWTWLFEQAKTASHIVLSSELMLYGGIVPSRLHYITREKCAQRLRLLEKLKAENPETKLYTFGLITRAPAYNGAYEEPDYYEMHGYDIHRFGVVSDMLSLGVQKAEAQAEKEGITQRVPAEFLDDFALRRDVNFASHIEIINLAAAGIIDHLIIPLDDCKEFGWASAERKRLARYAAKKNMLSKIAMYPGADEIGCTLVAKAICDITNCAPRIFLDYTSNTGKLTVPSYEDRSIGETAPHHALNGGAQLAVSPEQSDAVLFINPPTAFSQRLETEGDRREIHMECERNLPAFICRAKTYIGMNKPCFVADCAIPNGADKCLVQFMRELDMLNEFVSYSGWNTSSNAMGTVMACAIAYTCASLTGRLTKAAQDAANEFRLCRYIEDWGYMVEVRKPLTERLCEFGEGLSYSFLADKEKAVADKATEMLRDFTNEYFPHCGYTVNARMPWNRMFEIDLTLVKK